MWCGRISMSAWLTPHVLRKVTSIPVRPALFTQTWKSWRAFTCITCLNEVNHFNADTLEMAADTLLHIILITLLLNQFFFYLNSISSFTSCQHLLSSSHHFEPLSLRCNERSFNANTEMREILSASAPLAHHLSHNAITAAPLAVSASPQGKASSFRTRRLHCVIITLWKTFCSSRLITWNQRAATASDCLVII